MVRFNGVNHLAMATGDMDTTIRYWRDLLGMRLVAGTISFRSRPTT
jgi:catechol 2,3-dioxygenase-like lactoylglutathione lyase family enzyme